MEEGPGSHVDNDYVLKKGGWVSTQMMGRGQNAQTGREQTKRKNKILIWGGRTDRHAHRQAQRGTYKGGAHLKKSKRTSCEDFNKLLKQAGAELGQAQLKLGLDFTLIICRFGFSPFGLIELV